MRFVILTDAEAATNGNTERGGETVREGLCGSKFQILAVKKNEGKS